MIRNLAVLAALCLTANLAWSQVDSQTPRVDADGSVLPEGAIARLGFSRFRFDGALYCPIAFADDGKLLATGNTSSVSVFETATHLAVIE
ncbi:MAG TPA: hypothetical protein VHR66_22590 [Gemmataceae bacterium]|jgi:hypothetical protein|nr:hypothetical protein [Gemmataceae bacterium]